MALNPLLVVVLPVLYILIATFVCLQYSVILSLIGRAAVYVRSQKQLAPLEPGTFMPFDRSARCSVGCAFARSEILYDGTSRSRRLLLRLVAGSPGTLAVDCTGHPNGPLTGIGTATLGVGPLCHPQPKPGDDEANHAFPWLLTNVASSRRCSGGHSGGLPDPRVRPPAQVHAAAHPRAPGRALFVLHAGMSFVLSYVQTWQEVAHKITTTTDLPA